MKVSAKTQIYVAEHNRKIKIKLFIKLTNDVFPRCMQNNEGISHCRKSQVLHLSTVHAPGFLVISYLYCIKISLNFSAISFRVKFNEDSLRDEIHRS